MTNQGVQDLAYAIVIQAVEDWRSLCKGKTETKHCNFIELQKFFKNGCEGYIDTETAERIYDKLKKERKKSGLYGTGAKN